MLASPHKVEDKLKESSVDGLYSRKLLTCRLTSLLTLDGVCYSAQRWHHFYTLSLPRHMTTNLSSASMEPKSILLVILKKMYPTLESVRGTSLVYVIAIIFLGHPLFFLFVSFRFVGVCQIRA